MQQTVRIANPAGNITAFVLNPVPEELYASVAAQLLALPEYGTEQVAFCVPPRMGGDGRIQMMGGEFCGNATRSYGYLLHTQLPGNPTRVMVEVSGADRPLAVYADSKAGASSVEMPTPVLGPPVLFQGQSYPTICFEGIVHTVVPGQPRSQEFVEGLIVSLQKTVDSSAYGVMFVEDDHMTPAVYVGATDSLIWEGSCGSGSVAVAALCALQQGECSCRLVQPGGVIEAKATAQNGIVTACSMGGPVTLSEEMLLCLPEE